MKFIKTWEYGSTSRLLVAADFLKDENRAVGMCTGSSLHLSLRNCHSAIMPGIYCKFESNEGGEVSHSEIQRITAGSVRFRLFVELNSSFEFF